MSVYCLKCGALATLDTVDSDAPLCWAHGGGEPNAGENEPRPEE